MKIGIFDDHNLINFALRELIKNNFPGHPIVFSSSVARELLELIETHHPEILILDVVAPDVSGLELFEKISINFPSIKIIAYTALTSPVIVENLLSLNIHAYINKRQTLSSVIDAIEQVIDGNKYLPDDYKYLLKKREPFKENSRLSAREITIINLIASEFTSSAIAEKLNISENTVENHRKNIFQKLKVKNSAGLILEATRLGYLS